MSPEQREAQDRQAAEAERKRTADTEAREVGVAMCHLASDLGKRYSPAAARLDNYATYAKGQREALAQLETFQAAWPESLQQGDGLIFLGSVGTGKDHLLAAMLYRAARQGFNCRWIGGQELYGRFRDQIDTPRPEREQIADLVEPQILGISDPIPATGDLTKWNLDQLYRLIDRRYRDVKSTWITMNVPNVAEADAKLSSQVFDRLRESATVVRCFWPSFRERKAHDPRPG